MADNKVFFYIISKTFKCNMCNYRTTSSVVAMSSVAATNIPSNSVIAPLPSSSITATKNSTSAAMSVDRQGGVAVTLFVAGITSWYLA